MLLDRILDHCLIAFIVTAAALMSVISPNAQAESKASDMTNEAIGHPASHRLVDKPEDYYANRVRALALVRQEQWAAARPIIESLTGQYQDDGDTWYLLGLTYRQLGHWQRSIDAFKRTLGLGASLSGIPTGSAPSNDIMINIAEAYAELGQEADAIAWINKALAARYDGRKDLMGNPHFQNIAESNAFQRASGSFLPKNLSRDQSWQFDLDFLVSEIKRLHVNVYHAVSKEVFEQMAARISERIPALSDQEIVFEFMKLVAALGNGHNFIIPAYAEKGSFDQLPLQFYQFNDGLFIVNADDQYQQFIGRKVVAIGDTSVDEALAKIKTVNARDNEMQQLWLGPHYLGLPMVLKGLNIVNDAQRVSLTIEDAKGTQQVITPTPRAMVFNGFPKLPALAENTAIHNLRINEQYWYQLVPEMDSVYVQYNFVHNNPALSFEDFNVALRKAISQADIKNVILDIRHNAGGDGSTYPPILKTLVEFEALKPDGKLFIIVGRNTFSAAHNALLDVTRLTNAIVVGEPSGSRPNALSEAGWVRLPYSGTLGIISSQFHQVSEPEDHRIWVAPQVPVSLSSEEYFSGKDPAMEAIFKIIGTSLAVD